MTNEEPNVLHQVQQLLTDRQWDVWVLHHGAGHTYAQIADLLGITPQTAHAHHHAATRRIERHFRARVAP